MGRHLLELGFRFEIQVLTGNGIQNLKVASEQEWMQALDRLLCQPAVEEGSILAQPAEAAWHCHIGGGTDEA